MYKYTCVHVVVYSHSSKSYEFAFSMSYMQMLVCVMSGIQSALYAGLSGSYVQPASANLVASLRASLASLSSAPSTAWPIGAPLVHKDVYMVVHHSTQDVYTAYRMSP